MFESILWLAPSAAGAIYLLTPFVLHSSFRLAARCKCEPIALDLLPQEISAEVRKRIAEFSSLGFELAGTYDCGSLASGTHSFVAYFCNHATSEFANVTAMATSDGPASYIEFSSRFADGRTIETNSNGILPLLPTNPATAVFRFAEIQEPRALLKLHRRLTEKYAPGMCALGEPREEEIQRYVRTIEGVGPRLAKSGFMRATGGGEAYELTWKGAIHVAWLGLWPMTFLRKSIHRHAMQLELHTLETRTEAALQKA